MSCVEDFLALDAPCLDVRSPKEFLHAKIPGAINVPLFTDDERALIGTAYKRQGRDVAIRLGVKIVGPKLDQLLQYVDENIAKKNVKVYCWRGGMRSGFVRYFLEIAGYSCVQLKGGYKAFRRYILSLFARPYKLVLIGGFTGCGKTEILQALGQQIIDLEKLACHRGSVYGEHALQPQNEHFENELGISLHHSDPQVPIWVEDESRLIGKCQIPAPFYEAMKRSTLFVINAPKDLRIQRIVDQYCTQFSKEQLAALTLKIAKRLGGARTQTILSCIENGAFADAVRLVLEYYDKAYEYALSRHQGKVIHLPEEDKSPEAWAKQLREMMR